MSERGLYVYHRVPTDLRGDVLYPLNRLQGVYPDLYARLQQNYATRRDIAALRIPPLDNCLWNDVLHLSPVHPARIAAALADAGHSLPEAWRRFFQIDARLLAGPDTVIYSLQTAFWPGRFDVREASEQIGRECLAFDAETLSRFDDVPDAAKDYYASVAPANGGPALFLFVPHVLYRGLIDLNADGISIIEL